MDKNNSLIKRIIKYKKLQKLAHALVMIIPKPWLNAMNWSRDTRFVLEFHPIKKEILLIEDEEAGDPKPEAD